MAINKDMNQAPDTPRRRNGNRRLMRRILPYLGAVVLVGLIVAGLWPQPVPVEVSPVTLGTVRTVVSEEGKTRIRQRFMVSAPVGGQLRRVPLKAGAEVKEGETVVAVIDPLAPGMLDARARSLAEARRDSAAANLDKAKANHEFAMNELKRFEKLYKEKTVSAQELESVQLRESAAAKDKAAAEGGLRQAEAELAEFGAGPGGSGDPARAPREVRSPANGKVLRVIEESARAVMPGTPLLEIGDPADLEVVIEVLSRDGAAIQPGATVDLEQWGGGEPLKARVRLVEPAAFTKVSALGVEEQRVRVIADLETPPERRLSIGDNFRVEARIILSETENVLKVPAGALFRQGSSWAAFVVSQGKAQLKPVKAGRTGGSEVQVTEGLAEKDEVILYPGSRVKDGQRVRPIKI